jgi:uncharacterized protein YneF (UPF0154 family)
MLSSYEVVAIVVAVYCIGVVVGIYVAKREMA